MFEIAWNLIRKYSRIIIHRHTNPDGDALGSQIGLKQLILANCPNTQVYTVGDAPKRYSFMNDSTADEIPDAFYQGALAVVLDTAVPELVSDTRFSTAAETLRFDHHLFCGKFCDTELIDTSFESCCGLIAAMAEEQNLILTKEAAQALYTGMVTDSGRFRYDSTSPRTFRLAAYLTEQPLDVSALYANLYADDFSMVQTRAKFVLKVQFTEKNTAYIMTTKEELRDLCMDAFAASRGMVGVMSDIRNVPIWVNFTETDAGVLCELRSSEYNINPIAVKYGGGGHMKASGATVKDFDVARAMLRDLDTLTEVQNG